MFRKAAELKDPNGMFIWATIQFKGSSGVP